MKVSLKYVVPAKLIRESIPENPIWADYNPGNNATLEQVQQASEKFHEAVIRYHLAEKLDETKVDKLDNYVICEWSDIKYVSKSRTGAGKLLEEFFKKHYYNNLTIDDVKVVASIS